MYMYMYMYCMEMYYMYSYNLYKTMILVHHSSSILVCSSSILV